ncbi:SH3 domain-containing protein [Magnetospirillum molischianum]|uniref:SH3b domain-containing protein n=1 Tax=Magnetospirillum molischianum DSM 120 TaxID=1150626 RepID=H8FQX8_MAGML|nr:hypothetical protein [Magnetospirillum molischianum]CCG40766.1 conserved exported hypothetical protein [Magnetospirillum molischianum DSM 120]
MKDWPLSLAAPIFFLLVAGEALATADGPDHYRVQSIAEGEALEMRTTPNQDAPRVNRIPANATCLRNLGCQGGMSFAEFSTLSEDEKLRRGAENPRWCKVEYQKTIGWVEGRFLAEAACTTAAPPDEDRRIETIRFTEGTSSTTIRRRIKGREYVDYLLRAKAGQTLEASLTASNGQNYFNINPPGTDVSMFVGSMSGDHVKRVIPDDGDYTVRVYLMRPAARRNESSDYTLRLSLTGKPFTARPASSDALIDGTPFHAAATLSCALGAPPKRQNCEAFVVRRGFDGTATVEIRWTEGPVERTRRILFVKGKPVSSDAPDPVSHVRRGDLTITRIGTEEHFDIPDAFVGGG